jgi:hypothetical protein
VITVRIGLSRLSRIVVVVNAIGVRIARSQVLAFFVKAELRAGVWVFLNDRGQGRSCEGCEGCDDNSGVDQSAFHIGLLTTSSKALGDKSASLFPLNSALENTSVRTLASAAYAARTIVVGQQFGCGLNSR